MPELHFKGKEFVYNHHLTVPYRPLVAHPDKSIGEESGNLIDPPYNTGNENWNYNDNVNSPIMREWLDGNPVNKEDMLRHDKWLCMMYPRLKLLHELLSESGSFWMTLDDNEIHRARMVLDEVFGEEITKRKDKRHLVFAPVRFVPNKMLLPLGVEHAPLPWALYRLEKD